MYICIVTSMCVLHVLIGFVHLISNIKYQIISGESVVVAHRSKPFHTSGDKSSEVLDSISVVFLRETTPEWLGCAMLRFVHPPFLRSFPFMLLRKPVVIQASQVELPTQKPSEMAHKTFLPKTASGAINSTQLYSTHVLGEARAIQQLLPDLFVQLTMWWCQPQNGVGMHQA